MEMGKAKLPFLRASLTTLQGKKIGFWLKKLATEEGPSGKKGRSQTKQEKDYGGNYKNLQKAKRFGLSRAKGKAWCDGKNQYFEKEVRK